MKFCPNCGKEIRENAKFCAGCGYVLANYQAPGVKETNHKAPAAKETDYQAKETGYQAPEKETKTVNPFENIGTKEPRYSDYTDFKKNDYSETRSSGSYAYDGTDGYTTSQTNGYAIASLICGILAFPLNFLLFIPGILAIIFGIVGLNRSKETGSGYGLSIAGLILGIIACAGYIILLISAFFLAVSL